MIIENTFSVDAPREVVAAHLLDAERTLRCVPGVEGVEPVGENAYAATLKAKVGPIRASFQGRANFDASEAPNRIAATGEGRDRATGSMAQVRLEAALAEGDPGVTTVSTRADVAIRGRFGQFGTGVIQAIADEMIREFAKCIQAQIAGTDDARQATLPATGSLVGVAARGLVKGSAAKLSGLHRRGEEH